MLIPNTIKQALKAGKVQYGLNLGQFRSQDALKIVAAAGYNFRRLLAWLALWLAVLTHTLCACNERNPA